MQNICGKYQILEQIAHGTFGEVYRGIHMRTKYQVAIKLEPIESCINSLRHEARVYQSIGNISGFLKVKSYGTTQTHTYLITQLLGRSLEIGPWLQLPWIAREIFTRLRDLHQIGLIHRDIKPSNFIYNLEQNKIFLIDMGFCVSITTSRDVITTGLIGTPNYVSIAVHDGKIPAACDDLESAIYVLLYCYYGGKLPWLDKSDADIIKLKQTYNFALEWIINCLNYIRKIGPLDQIDYNLLINAPTLSADTTR